MKKLIPFLFLAVTGCTTVGGAVDLINPLKFFQTGFYPLVIVAELETNLSSIIIDKTKARVKNFDSRPYEILPENSTIFVMPAVIMRNREKTYDDYYSRMMSNYLKMNNFATPVADIAKADYILRLDIDESTERRIGENFSRIQVTIMEKNESPVFYSTINIISKSDRNFYYYPSKSARPVKELTLYGLEEIFQTGLPQAFGSDHLEG